MEANRSADGERKTFFSNRQDGRFSYTAGFVQAFIKSRTPELTFDPDIDTRDFPAWRDCLRDKVGEVMAFPEVSPLPEPERLLVEQGGGYQRQRWEICPEPHYLVPILMLVPDETSQRTPTPAMMCFPGFSGSKKGMAGKPELNDRELNWREKKWRNNCIPCTKCARE